MDTTRTFEFRFSLVATSEQSIEAIDREFDALFSINGDRDYITLLARGSDAVDTALATSRRLGQLGSDAERLEPDFVTSSEIADRLGVRRQAVQLWSTGRRRDNFPRPRIVAATSLWYWPEVVEWSRLEQAVPDPSEDIYYPSFDDTSVINAVLRCGSRVALSQPRGSSQYQSNSGPVKLSTHVTSGVPLTIHDIRVKGGDFTHGRSTSSTHGQSYV